MTRDFINPESAWPQLSALERRTADAGHELRERLAIYPEYAIRSEFVDARLQATLAQCRGENGFAKEDA